LASSQVSAGELQSVYVAPGGIYIASGAASKMPGVAKFSRVAGQRQIINALRPYRHN
jgi:hypothetical protein